MDNLYNQRIIQANNLFEDSFLDVNVLYLFHYDMIPDKHYIGHIDGEKAFNIFRDKYGGSIRHIHRYCWLKSKNKQYQFDKTVVVMNNRCIIDFNDSYCEILHDGKQDALVQELTTLAAKFKERQRKQPLEINLVVQKRGALDIKSMEIKRTKLDLGLFYEDDFKETDELIRKRLSRKKDKGIVLLHGLPGTGKTTYLRYLIGKIKKRVLFLSPAVAGNLMNPDFIELLMDNTNTVLVIEDAENIIMDRKFHTGSSVSNLLNISDGLMADFLHVQLICTFNSPLTMVDSALLRKGRLIAKYEFGKLGIEKGQRLSRHLGFDTKISKPMTIAEITNPHEKDQKKAEPAMIGFRRELIDN